MIIVPSFLYTNARTGTRKNGLDDLHWLQGGTENLNNNDDTTDCRYPEGWLCVGDPSLALNWILGLSSLEKSALEVGTTADKQKDRQNKKEPARWERCAEIAVRHAPDGVVAWPVS